MYVVMFIAPPEVGSDKIIILPFENGHLSDEGEVKDKDPNGPLKDLPDTKAVLAEITDDGGLAAKVIFDAGEPVYAMEHLILANLVAKIMYQTTGSSEMADLHHGLVSVDEDELFTAPVNPKH